MPVDKAFTYQSNPLMNRASKQFALLFVIIIVLVNLFGCAHHYQPSEYADPYGFVSGIIHGALLPISFIASIFIDNVYVFGEPNTGFFYYIGFLIGVYLIIKRNN
jgi:hypothetical protein